MFYILNIVNFPMIYTPMAPFVLLSFNIPKAMLGKTQAKYRNSIVDVTFCGVLLPKMPGNTNNK